MTDALLGFFDKTADDRGIRADLTGANFWEAIYDPETRWPRFFVPHRQGAIKEKTAAEEAAKRRTGIARTFVVGDVHGHAEKLHRLVAQLQKRATSGDRLVFLGDLIDRGPDTRGVIELVLALANGGWDGPVTALRGHHEDMLLHGLDGHPDFAPGEWFGEGGIETLDSYAGENWTMETWRDLLPPAHHDLLRRLQAWYQDENGIYVHAGLTPGRPPEETPAGILFWVRHTFYNSDYRWEKVVVFGHTPQHEPPEGGSTRWAWRPMYRVLPERAFVSAP